MDSRTLCYHALCEIDPIIAPQGHLKLDRCKNGTSSQPTEVRSYEAVQRTRHRLSLHLPKVRTPPGIGPVLVVFGSAAAVAAAEQYVVH